MDAWRAFLAFLFVATWTVALAASGEAPTEFRGLKWGANPTKTLNKVSGPSGAERLSVWTNRSKNLPPYLGISVAEEAYLFEGDKLFSGQLFIDGAQNFETAKDALTKQFGQPDFKNERLKMFKWKWTGQRIEISLTYQEKFQRTSVGFTKDK